MKYKKLINKIINKDDSFVKKYVSLIYENKIDEVDQQIKEYYEDYINKVIKDFYKNKKGYVYIFCHPNQDIYKIGCTKVGIEKRLKTLNSSGLLGDYVCLYKKKVFDCFYIEKVIKRELNKMQIQCYKELYKTSYSLLEKTIEDVIKKEKSKIKNLI